MNCPACNAFPLRESARVRGLAYCPRCRNYFYGGLGAGAPIPEVLRAMVEVTGFPDALSGERPAAVCARVADCGEGLTDALLEAAACGVDAMGYLAGDGDVAALAGAMMSRARLSVEAAHYLASCYAYALGLAGNQMPAFPCRTEETRQIECQTL